MMGLLLFIRKRDQGDRIHTCNGHTPVPMTCNSYPKIHLSIATVVAVVLRLACPQILPNHNFNCARIISHSRHLSQTAQILISPSLPSSLPRSFFDKLLDFARVSEVAAPRTPLTPRAHTPCLRSTLFDRRRGRTRN